MYHHRRKRPQFVLLTALMLFCTAFAANGVSPITVSPCNDPQEEQVTTPSLSVCLPSESTVAPLNELIEVVEITPSLALSKSNEPVVEEHKSYYTYTEEELDLMSRLIFSEGGGESYDTMLKIGSVVMNRVMDSTYFPDTIYEVIYQKNQFSVTTHKIKGVTMIDRPASEEAKAAALEVLEYGSVLPDKVQVFYEKSITEGWLNSRARYGTYDCTTFAYIYSEE